MKMYKTEEIKQSLLKKGFILKEGDHSYFVFYHSGKATGIFTKVSHGSTPPGKDILSKIKRQLHFSSQKDFEKLIDCPMKQEEYENYLKRQNLI
ncbi:MAG: type II toxin-antitoxin system HicA family toxin [Thermoplasmataceae archaeon]